MSRHVRRFLWVALAAALVGVGGAVAFRNAAWWLDVSEPPTFSEYVVVLPGDADRRPFVAAALINTGLAHTALVPENLPGPDVIDGITPPANEIIVRVLRKRGVPRERILLLRGASDSTSGDMELIAAFLREHRESKITFVTSAFHTRRARWVIRRWLRQVPGFSGEVHIVAAPNPCFEADTWWHTEAGFFYVTSEYCKLVAYWFLYGSGVYWTVAAMFVAVAFLVRRMRARAGQAGMASRREGVQETLSNAGAPEANIGT